MNPIEDQHIFQKIVDCTGGELVWGIAAGLVPLFLLLVINQCKLPNRLNKKTEINVELIKSQAQEFENKIAVELGLNCKVNDDFETRISRLIEYAIGRQDWYEEQRFRIYQTVLVIVGLFIPFVGGAAQLTNDPLKFVAFPFLFSALLVVCYFVFRTTNEYGNELSPERAYRKIASTPSYFYRYSIPNFSSSKGGVKETAIMRGEFFEIMQKTFEESNSIREDLEQLFILHILQGSRHASTGKLRQSLNLLMFFITIIVTIFFGFILFAELK